MLTGSRLRSNLSSTLFLTFFLTLLPGTPVVGGEAPSASGFLANTGQIDGAVAFYTTGSGFAVYLTHQGPVLQLRSFVPSAPDSSPTLASVPLRSRETRRPGSTRRVAVGVRFVGASGPSRIEPVGEPLVRRHYFLGSNVRHAVPAFRQVAYRDVWPGIDIVYEIYESGLKYHVIPGPGADLSRVRLAYDGAAVAESSEAQALLKTPLGDIEDRHPPREGGAGRLRWSLSAAAPDSGSTSVRQAPGVESVSSLDSLAWGTFIGGSLDEAVYAMVVDALGRPIVTGATWSDDFPTTLGVVDTTYGGSFDAFVAQFSADGSQLLWSTYLGGTGDDRGWAIALDGSGNPVVAGVTSDDSFPTTTGAFDETGNGEYDAFVLKLAADGSAVIWSTLYGGSAREWDVSGLALDALGRPVVAGSTRSGDLPTSVGALDASLGGASDAFVARFTADGTGLDYGTYLGGGDWDVGEDVVVAASGAAIVVGDTSSDDFPTTAGAFQPGRIVPTQDAFVARLAPDGGSLEFGTYLGGSAQDYAYVVVLDDAEDVIVSGRTNSADFPTTAGAAYTGPLGGDDAFVTKVHSDGGSQIWGTYFGGSGSDRALDLVRNGWDGFSFVGWSCSDDLPVIPEALAGAPGGPCEGYLAIVPADGSRVDYCSYVGGWRDETVFAVAVDPVDQQVVAGETWSTNFPVSAGSYSPVHNSPDQAEDGFVAALHVATFCAYLEEVAGDLVLSMQLAVDGQCPEPAMLESVGLVEVDLVEGELESLSLADTGVVTRVRCATQDSSIGSVSRPALGTGLFLMARDQPAGSYTDGAGSGLLGPRVPLAGDCP